MRWVGKKCLINAWKMDLKIREKKVCTAFDRSRKKAIEYYINHGNEANMQPAYLFNYSGKPL